MINVSQCKGPSKIYLYTGPEQKGDMADTFSELHGSGHRDFFGVDKTGHLLFYTKESVTSNWAMHTKLHNIYRRNTFPTHIMSD